MAHQYFPSLHLYTSDKYRKFISSLVIINHAFYKINEAEVIHYNPEKSGTKIFRMYPKKRHAKSKNAYLLLQL